jgi:hypothetical protein
MLNAASAGATASVGIPCSRKASAKPKPCTKPNTKVARHRLLMSCTKKFSAATETSVAAISGSTTRRQPDDIEHGQAEGE